MFYGRLLGSPSHLPGLEDFVCYVSGQAVGLAEFLDVA